MRILFGSLHFKPGACKAVESTGRGPTVDGVIHSETFGPSPPSIASWFLGLVRHARTLHFSAVAFAKDIPTGLYLDGQLPNLAWSVVGPNDHGGNPYCYRWINEGAFRRYLPNDPGALPIDLLVLNDIPMARRIEMLLYYPHGHWYKRSVPPLVLRHESGYGQRGSVIPDEYFMRPACRREKRFVLGQTIETHHWFLNEAQMKNFGEMIYEGEGLGALGGEQRSQWTVIANGVDLSECRSHVNREGVPPRRIGCFSRPISVKGVKEAVGWIIDLLGDARVDDAVVTWETNDAFEALGLGPPPDGLVFHNNCSRVEYLRAAAGCRAGIFNSTNESSPIGCFEAAAVGCIPLLPAREWVSALPGSYPFVYDSRKDLMALVELTLSEYQEAKRRMDAYLDQYIDMARLSRTVTSYLSRVGAQDNPFRAGTGAERIHSWCREQGWFDDVIRLAQKGFIEWDELPRGLEAVHPARRVNIVESLTGLFDQLDGPTPRFGPNAPGALSDNGVG